ncbi:uncharacterized protein KY384_007717 [Bacidia gigantensis]|uniref:uncharacterized protein n=1 Tax=Bacidia gigantensis TaxID=2732470 RepID=UPI001D0574E2|nr:uncharacterized protein KY384_007717 [Bacidia gigantensis]KAG8527564.1 hypothetical protein KY384_007717 [Bacidia gigantensis]
MAAQNLPPAQPAFILRGHTAQIHALHFTPGNDRLLTADADGWLVSWNLAFKRPAAVWKAHSNAILAVGSWGPEIIITHGRDNQLLVWRLSEQDEAHMDKTLPVEADAFNSQQPWLLHAMPVNALNFCPFAMCYDGMPHAISARNAVTDTTVICPILFAVPNAIDSGGIDIFELPSRKRAATVNSDRSITTGMVMALGIMADTTKIQLAAGFESGHTMVFVQTDPAAPFERLYCAKPHSQPVLSMVISPCKDHYITSSADANIVKHPFPSAKSIFKTEFKPIRVSATRHSGQQGLSYRSDGKLFATAGWDSAVRVYSAKTMKELAVLKWHKEGCYATAFATVKSLTDRSYDSNSCSTVAHEDPESKSSLGIAFRVSQNLSIQEKRNRVAQSTHWVAVGSKDGKISLWDIY